MKTFVTLLTLLAVYTAPTLASCPRKCYFDDLQSAPAVNKIPCPSSCQVYSCLKTFGPNLPAFGIGVACAEPGLPTESPLASPPPLDTIETCTGPVKELPFLSEVLPEASIPPCPASTPNPEPCPAKCYFPLKPEPEINFVPCPDECRLYSCLKTFPPMLPAFGIGVACAKPGLETTEAPAPPPSGRFNRKCNGEASEGDLPFLKDVLPEATLPPCPRT